MNIYFHIGVTVTSEPILSTAKPNADPTGDPTIESTVGPTETSSEKLWLTPTFTSILSFEVNIKTTKVIFGYFFSHLSHRNL